MALLTGHSHWRRLSCVCLRWSCEVQPKTAAQIEQAFSHQELLFRPARLASLPDVSQMNGRSNEARFERPLRVKGGHGQKAVTQPVHPSSGNGRCVPALTFRANCER